MGHLYRIGDVFSIVVSYFETVDDIHRWVQPNQLKFGCKFAYNQIRFYLFCFVLIISVWNDVRDIFRTALKIFLCLRVDIRSLLAGRRWPSGSWQHFVSDLHFWRIAVIVLTVFFDQAALSPVSSAGPRAAVHVVQAHVSFLRSAELLHTQTALGFRQAGAPSGLTSDFSARFVNQTFVFGTVLA